MSRFAPIAIVGRSCILPGAESPEALFDAVLEGRSLLTPTPSDRWRGIDPQILAQGREKGAHVASLMGGYVQGPALDVDDVARHVPDFARLDPVFQWLAHCATACARSTRAAPVRTGLIVGNLSYPSSLGAAFVEGYWRGESEVDARNRFSSGLPAHLVAESLGFGGPALALDAACASSLYAIKLACDALHDGEADLMVAGGVNRADDLFLHLGFTALQALSPSGASRPFHRQADGLVPSEGAALVALKRLDDAERDGDRIWGVIRAVGLSNDGRQNGFLAPSASGQARAMAQAFAQSGLAPRDIAFVDCHATGTARGDATEIESLSASYGRSPLQLGALKSVIGHAITASGAASLINLLTAFERGVAPPTRCAAPLEAIGDAGFTLLQTPVAWADGVRRAAVSNFGFGGNNAHLIVESHVRARRKRIKPSRPSGDIVVVGLGVVAGGARGVAVFRRRAFGARVVPMLVTEVRLALAGLGFPPSDLRASLGQQTLILEAAAEATAQLAPLPTDATGVFIGMGVDATIARHGVRLAHANEAGWRTANDGAAPALTPEGVVGAMPNIPANRINAQRDWRGPGFTVSSEELSGIAALTLALRALRVGEIDAALVGAVDLCCEPAHAAALKAVFPDAAAPGDAAVAFVLKRRADALAAGEVVLGVFDDGAGDLSAPEEVTARFGHAHAAQGLLQIAADMLALNAGIRIDAAGAQPDIGASRARRTVQALSGRHATVDVSAGVRQPTAIAPVPVLKRYAAATRDALCVRLEADAPGGEGTVRCAIVADGERQVAPLRARAMEALKRGVAPTTPGVLFAEAPATGEIAFTFTGAAAAYAGAGRDLLLAWPEVGDALAARHTGAGALARALYGADIGVLHPRVQLTGCALVCQAHASFSRDVLGLSPHAAIGLSSGETNALLAFGVWRDLDAMLAEIEMSGLYGDELTGDCRAAARAWGLAEDRADWTCWRIAAPVSDVEAALASEPRAYMTIIQAPEDCVIGGAPDACARVVDALGRGRAMPLGLDMIVHCAAMAPFGDAWRKIHTREAHPAPGVRFYSNAMNSAYTPTSEAAAEAITQQALNPIDFPATIRAAYDDGVRIFIEHGPRGILTTAIDRILVGKPHLAVALDAQERRGLRALSESVLKLWAHGVDVDVTAFEARLDALRREQEAPVVDLSRTLVLPAHRPDIVAVAVREVPPEVDASPASPAFSDLQIMEVAPQNLPPLAVFQTAPSLSNTRNAPSAAVGTRASAALRLISDIGETHRLFMAKQADAHAAFLQTRQSLVKAAMAGSRAVLQPSSAPQAPLEVVAAKVLYDRADLEVLAGGRISDVFGPLFAQQDGYARQVRMPQPPLLFADRVMLLEGEAGSMGKGRIVTETDVTGDAWYMHAGRMSPGVVIESGQADLLLASWLGADFHNRGERVYRLLGCDLTFMGELPRAGETLRYDIHIDGHAVSGETRLFFFHYDCYIGERLMISVRNGQAGFFSDEELQQSGGVLWEAEGDTPKADAQVDTPPCVTTRRQFDRAALDALVEGRSYACFGAGFERAAAHTRTPSLPGGKLKLLDEVAEFHPTGGPWGRGYLRVRAHVPNDAWFYDGHFKNDPCMPGTLMADAATQALAFAMAAYGFTIERDGWRFEPVPGEMARFVCRGQVTPETAHDLDYEVFIEEIIDGPTPTVFAALLCRSDGFKVFHCRRFGMRLVPDWPVDIAAHAASKRIVGQSTDVRGDLGGLTACALGKPSDAFGALYAPFDGARRAPRLPADPYHFVSRILSVDGAPGVPAEGGAVVAEYDAPPDAWYFTDGGTDAVPLSVLTEVLLQPCGWLASYMGFAANRVDDVAFRNLDGNEVLLHRPARAGVLRVTARLERFAEAGGSTIVFFNVACTQGGELVMTMKTAFGFFSPSALQSQVGLPATDEMRAALVHGDAPFAVLEDVRRRTRHLSSGRLRLLESITAHDRDGGAAGLGRLVARASVDPGAWFFKAHFFQDPVQPGSLGLEAIQQALRAALTLRMDADDGEYEPVSVGTPFTWRFRGQVVPANYEVFAEVELTSIMEVPDGVRAVANGSYWVDGLRIYEVKGMAARWKRGRLGGAT